LTLRLKDLKGLMAPPTLVLLRTLIEDIQYHLLHASSIRWCTRTPLWHACRAGKSVRSGAVKWKQVCGKPKR